VDLPGAGELRHAGRDVSRIKVEAPGEITDSAPRVDGKETEDARVVIALPAAG
jgi:hypothetical protein